MTSGNSVQTMKNGQALKQCGYYRRTACRYCDAQLAEPFLELGEMALANSFLEEDVPSQEEFTCPLSVVYCPRCHLVQLTHVVDPKRMFSRYLYVSSTSKTFQRHFADYARQVSGLFQSGRDLRAVDIGSNDGCLLGYLREQGMKVLGVEPASNLSRLANQKGLKTLNRFFDDGCRDEILSLSGGADVITANNVFAHIDDVASVCRNVECLLSREGVFVIEFPDLIVMCREMLFDMIYHEHLSYISVTALSHLAEAHGLEIFDVRQVSSHGGSLRVFLQRRGARRPATEATRQRREAEQQGGFLTLERYQDFARSVASVKGQMACFIGQEQARGGRMAGYGAPAKANTLINYCGITRDQVEYIVDDNPLKQGTFCPGSRIPVVERSRLRQAPPDSIIIFAWNFAREIIDKLKQGGQAGKRFYVPLPAPRLVD